MTATLFINQDCNQASKKALWMGSYTHLCFLDAGGRYSEGFSFDIGSKRRFECPQWPWILTKSRTARGPCLTFVGSAWKDMLAEYFKVADRFCCFLSESFYPCNLVSKI